MCFFCFLNSPLKANDDLIKLFHLAVESGDTKLINEVIEALLKMENNSKNLLDALAKYSENGKIDFALHNAIKDKNILASVILAYHSKDVNTRKAKETCNCVPVNIHRDAKTPIELAFESDMIELIPYLLMKNANHYLMRDVAFLYEGEENLDYLIYLFPLVKKTCRTTNKVGYETSGFQRNLISDSIINNRLDVIETLNKAKTDWNRICCKAMGSFYTPLQLSLAIKRYDIAQFLIDHGVRIE